MTDGPLPGNISKRVRPLKKRQLSGDTLKKQLKERARDRVYTFVLSQGTVRAAFINGTRMINEMRANFGYGILETLVAGHGYLACGLLTSTLKGRDRLALAIECSGPIKGLSVEANAFGEIRGHLKQVPIPIEKPMEDFNLSPFFGGGFLSVTKYLEDMKQPYTGQVMLAHGNIAQDLAHYFKTSEQTDTVFSLSIQFDPRGEVTGAGGLYLQAMPGASEETRAELERAVQAMPSPGLMMAEGRDPVSLLDTHLRDFSPKFLNDDRIEFFCRCTEEKFADYIKMLPMSDLEDLAVNGPFPLEAKCHNCATSYEFSRSQLEAFLKLRKA